MPLITRFTRIIITSAPVKFIIRSSKKIKLPGFQGIPLFNVVRFFVQQVQQVDLNERASAISFNFLMSIPPALIFLLTLVPYFPISDQFVNEMYSLIREIIPGEKNNKLLISFLDDLIRNPRTELLSAGILLALFYSSNAMMGIMRSFDQGYLGFKKRKGLQQRITAIWLTFILFILFFTAILLLAMQGEVLKWIGIENPNIRALINFARLLIVVLLFFYSISFIYRHAPAIHKKWKLINPGSILATFMMLVFITFFSYWIDNFAGYNKLYGSIGTILIIMLLIYFNSLVLLIGFELNASITSLKHKDDERKN